MKKIIFLILFINSILQAQYIFTSKYLSNPDLAIGYVDSCANFWFKAWDNSLGGFFTNVAKNGDVLYSWGSNKDMLTQSRNAYGLTRAFMLTGNDEYLLLAEKALNFMYDNSWDKNFGGWINGLSSSGKPTNALENKTAFYQHYALLGITTFFEATRDTSTWDWLIKGYKNNEEKLWDSDPNYFGYFDYSTYNWLNKKNKSFNATVDAITTHLLYLYLMTKDEVYRQKLIDVTKNISSHLIESMPYQKIGFAEKYNSNWQILSNETLTIMGHVLKTSWCLARMAQIIDSSDYLLSAESLFNHVIDKGYDQKYGGPYKDYDRLTGEMKMWGNPDTAKAWWQMEQAIVAGLQLYNLTQKDEYLKIADETLDFFMKYFVDHIFGEVYENRTRRGEETWGEHKGNGAKAAYHSIELGYYNYIYGNLFVHNKPITLFYSIKPQNFSRSYDLTPIAISDGKLKISAISLDGQEFSNFDKCKIYIPSGVGGKFEVTFEMNNPSFAEYSNENSLDFIQLSNYPNPFNSFTNIKYYLPKSSNIRIDIYNALGELVETLENSYKSSGMHQLSFNSNSLSSGVYYCRLISENNLKTHKILILK